jgi:uncharacterized protein (DUF952 family)
MFTEKEMVRMTNRELANLSLNRLYECRDFWQQVAKNMESNMLDYHSASMYKTSADPWDRFEYKKAKSYIDYDSRNYSIAYNRIRHIQKLIIRKMHISNWSSARFRNKIENNTIDNYQNMICKIIAKSDLDIIKGIGFIPDQPADTDCDFIHSCSADQISSIVKKFYNGDAKSVLVAILDEKSITAEGFDIKYETNIGSTSGVKYYHLYRNDRTKLIPKSCISNMLEIVSID